MNKPFYSVALLAAALLAGHLQADAQTVTKVKTKTSKSAKATAGNLATPPPPPAEGEGPDGPRPPRGPRGEHGPKGPHGGPRGERGGLQTITDVRGTLSSYVANNDDQVYDAFILKPESGAVDTVRFPRHLGQQLQAAAKAGSAVTVSGVRHTGPDGRSHFRFVSLTSGGQTINDAPPVRPTTPPTPETATAKGSIKELRRDPKGRIRGVVLSDQTVVQLPPHALEQLGDKLTVGAALEATGNLRTAQPGEARVAGTTAPRVVHAQTLALGGVKYLVR
ncbi:hypothetical protein KB206_05110 [Microvirga sp. STS02]|uniref:hypothetical protein n=1 Tax=Hymenobacter negativus TaxID=2795026 RepID=UPI0018DD59EA|nr:MULTISPECIES: hypothetical protein [Bacteria]MBH8568250.1 hypothetical protein [Hymenobacter negativus]MBR7207985.1 hypothetical protein [Microvirga sp. STS02]